MTLYTGISQLVTMSGPPRARTGEEMSAVEVVHKGALAVEGGKIILADRADVLLPRFPSADVCDLEGRVVTPGLVDAHTHLAFGGDRLADFEARSRGESYEQIAARGGGILSTVRKTREASDSALLASTQRHRRWCLDEGTTTIEAKSGYGLSVDHELRILGIYETLNQTLGPRIIATLLGAHALPQEARDLTGYCDLVEEEMIPLVAARRLAKYCDIFVEEAYFGDAEARRIVAKAQGAGLGVRMHVDQLRNSGGAQLAVAVGATTADHLEHTDEDGIRSLASSSVYPILLPASVQCLGKSRYPMARGMIDHGCPVVVATDFNPGSSPTPSLPFVMHLACTQMRMTPAEALTSVTVNAAASLGIADSVGSLEPGKRADFVVWDINDWRELSYWVGRRLVHSVYMDGQRLLPAAE